MKSLDPGRAQCLERTKRSPGTLRFFWHLNIRRQRDFLFYEAFDNTIVERKMAQYSEYKLNSSIAEKDEKENLESKSVEASAKFRCRINTKLQFRDRDAD